MKPQENLLESKDCFDGNTILIVDCEVAGDLLMNRELEFKMMKDTLFRFSDPKRKVVTPNELSQKDKHHLSSQIYESGLQQYWKVVERVRKDMKIAKLKGENEMELVKFEHLKRIFIVFALLSMGTILVFLAEIVHFKLAGKCGRIRKKFQPKRVPDGWITIISLNSKIENVRSRRRIEKTRVFVKARKSNCGRYNPKLDNLKLFKLEKRLKSAQQNRVVKIRNFSVIKNIERNVICSFDNARSN